ncbi:MAG: hypothetical protein AAGF01_25365 [Cyanobacteria bacterium P01_G01_bin.38]
MPHSLWDLIGPDGLHAAKILFGEAINHLAPFQSLETKLQGNPCVVLRLCDRNFRITHEGNFAPMLNALKMNTLKINALKMNVRVKQFDWLGSIFLPDSLFPTLVKQATVRPPHRLKTLPNHRAVPARLNDIPALIWRRPLQSKPIIELHAARTDLETLIKQYPSKKGSFS